MAMITRSGQHTNESQVAMSPFRRGRTSNAARRVRLHRVSYAGQSTRSRWLAAPATLIGLAVTATLLSDQRGHGGPSHAAERADR